MWTDGYTSELGYTYGYFSDLNPVYLKFVLLLAGYELPASNSLSYLELGYGQGVSVNIHAAANAGEFWGTDFLPEHTIFANKLNHASGASATLLNDSFSELKARENLPSFDVITLHGIWSWISEENRNVIIDIAMRNLKPGGLLFLSYNTSPGWSSTAPLRHLFREYSVSGDSGPPGNSVMNAVEFAENIYDAGAAYFKNNPKAVRKLKELKKHEKAYLTHEYLNASWDVLSFSEVAQDLKRAKLKFMGSVDLLDQIETLHLSDAAQKLLKSIASPVLKETVRDYFFDRQFRRDIFLKGALKLPTMEIRRRLFEQPFILLKNSSFSSLEISGVLGKAKLSSSVYEPVLEILAEDSFNPKSVDDLRADRRTQHINEREILQALVVLCGDGTVRPAVKGQLDEEVVTTCKRLNEFICQGAEASGKVKVVASPITGGGVHLSRIEQLFLLAERLDGDVVDWVYGIVKQQTLGISKDGTKISEEREKREEIKRQYDVFSRERLPLLRALKIL